MADTVAYMSYGSMCNPESLRRRGIHPTASQPCVLHGYRLSFNLGGMANLVADSSSSCHGILHTITPAMFEALHAIETNYDVLETTVTPYAPYSSSGASSSHASSMHVSLGCGSSASLSSGCGASVSDNGSDATAANGTPQPQLQPQLQPVAAKTFIVPQERLKQLEVLHPEWHTALPSERYITIITAGLRHFGADPAWVEAVAATPFAPCRGPECYMTVPLPADPSSLRNWTVSELAEYKGRMEDGKAVFAMGPKVVEVDCSAKPDGPFVKIIMSHMSGRDHTFGLCMNLYEPRLPPLHTPDDVTAEHIAWAEDMAMEWTSKQGFTVTQIGWLVKEAADTKGEASAAATTAEAAEAAAVGVK